MARRKEHTRAELEEMMLAESRKIIGESGFEGLTARKLAEAVGYTPGTIYNVFKSMDDLYLRLNAETLDRLYDVLSAPACNNPECAPLQNMKLMAAHYKDFCQQNRPYWLMLFEHKLASGRQAPDWFTEKIERLFLPLEDLLRPYYAPVADKKRKMAARILWSSVHGLCFLEQTGKFGLVNDEATINTMMDYLIDNFIAGISA